MLFVSCLCFLTMCKESLKCVIFLKASNNFKKEVSFQRVNFVPAVENVTAVRNAYLALNPSSCQQFGLPAHSSV